MPESSSKIQSIRQALAGGYRKPEAGLVERYQQELQGESLEYLTKVRGLNLETIANFKLGYSRERNAISIPVFKGGEVVNIRYRSLSPDATSRYTQEKGCEIWLYNEAGIEVAKEKRGILVVEGEFDLMSAWQNGFKNVVSAASGKDSYGVWIELLDQIPKVYIAYDNDEPGRQASLAMAERVGIDKCFEVSYPEGFKDANEFFLKHTREDFLPIVKAAKPYYKHKYSGVGDIIDSLMSAPEQTIQLESVPFVRWKQDWVGMITADSGFGKTTYALNIANELANRDIPTLVFPFERGIREVGSRYLQVRYDKQEEDFLILQPEEWKELKEDAVNLPLYFAAPKQDEFFDTVRRAKRLFDIKFIIIDHLDYFIRGKEAVTQQADFMHELKEFCIEVKVIAIVVHHIGKDKDRKRSKRIFKEDMKGSSVIYQVAEVVILMYEADDGGVTIEVAKNKGPEGKRFVEINKATGKISKPMDISNRDMEEHQRQIEEQWNG
jgi:DnaB-like helicase C terminal domain/Toprim-like